MVARKRKVRRTRKVRQDGGFALPALLGVHSALQSIKPITNGVALAKSLGVADRIDSALNSNAAGRALKSAGKFLQEKLGYGYEVKPRRRHRRVGRPRVHHGAGEHRHIGRPKLLH